MITALCLGLTEMVGLASPSPAVGDAKDFIWYCESDEATEAQKATVAQIYKAAGADPKALSCKEAFEAFNSTTLSLSFQGTPSTDLSPLAGLTGIKDLACEGCYDVAIASIPKLENLKFLELSGNNLTTFPDAKRFTNLNQFVLSNNETITKAHGSALPANLKVLSLNFTKIADLDFLSQLTNISRLSIEAPPAGTLNTLPKIDSLRTLNASSLEGSDYSFLDQTPNLTELHLYSNGIADISTIQFPANLKALFLEFNDIKEVPVGVIPTGLEEIGLGYNPIKSLKNVAEAKGLKFLNFRGAGFKNWSELDAVLPNLEFLDASENAFTAEDIQEGKAKSWLELRHLKINDTNIKSLAFFKNIAAPKLEIATLPEIKNKNEENCPTSDVPEVIAQYCAEK